MRLLRKHRIALLALVLYHFTFFFPTLFMGRVVSPNDVFYNYDPWSSVRHIEVVQNSLLNDPPTSYFTLMSLVKSDWRAFHWNPFVACGIPGFGSSAAAVLSPFILLPTLILPLPWIYTGIILLKLNVAFFFAYLWLREERLGKGAAAVGAILFAASGPVAVRWLWQATNAVCLYPAMLWIAVCLARGKRTPAWLIALLALAYALAGFPATMAYGAYAAAAYLVFLLILDRRIAWKPMVTAAATTLLAIAVAVPSLMPFIQFVRRSGYLPVRANTALQFAFPLRHFFLFVQPDHLGNPAYHNWTGDRALGILNNSIEATVFVGVIAVPLLLLALVSRRARTRWFWFLALAVILACMFGFAPVARLVALIPGFKYSPLTRLQLLLPIAVAYLAAAGASWLIRSRRTLIASLLVVVAAGELGVFAGRFYPYLETGMAVPPMTPVISFLQSQPKPFRIAPFFIYLWPNSSELYGLEDIRSHFSSEGSYRDLLHRVDPTSFANNSTVIQLNSLQFNFSDPLVSMLGVRYFIENRDIDIIKWTTFKYTLPGVKETGAVSLKPGAVALRHVALDAEPFYAVELPVTVERTTARSPRLIVSLLRGERALFSRAFTPSDIAVMEKVYVPVRPYAWKGETLLLRVQTVGLQVRLLKGATSIAGDAPLFYGRVTVPVVFDRELPDGRLFRNVGEVPRFHAVSRLQKMSEARFLAATNIDFADEAIITDPAAPQLEASDAEVNLRSYAEDEQQIDVHAPAATFLATSEKLTPELRVTVDGRAVNPVQINMLFAGVAVPAGNHHVIFSRRIARGWWWLSVAAALMCAALCVIDAVRR